MTIVTTFFEPYPIPPEDITPVEILAPSPESCGTSGDAVSVRIQNQGQLSASSIQVGYALNGIVQTVETIVGPLSAGASMVYTFNQALNYPGGGEYELTVWGSTLGDGDKSNDSISTSLVRYQQISSYPYQEDFENGAGGWTTGGTKTDGNWQTLPSPISKALLVVFGHGLRMRPPHTRHLKMGMSKVPASTSPS